MSSLFSSLECWRATGSTSYSKYSRSFPLQFLNYLWSKCYRKHSRSPWHKWESLRSSQRSGDHRNNGSLEGKGKKFYLSSHSLFSWGFPSFLQTAFLPCTFQKLGEQVDWLIHYSLAYFSCLRAWRVCFFPLVGWAGMVFCLDFSFQEESFVHSFVNL